MLEVSLQTDRLIDTLYETEFVREMIRLRNKIVNENIVIDRNNEIIKKYISNQNIFDLHIYYLNNEISKVINNKTCRSKNESN